VIPPRPTAHSAASSVPISEAIGPDATPLGAAAPSPAAGAIPASSSGPSWTAERLARVRAREPVALEEFFEAHFERVHALVYRLLGERALSEDVTQEVFFKAYRALDRLDPERDPGPWLTAIAYNACRDVWRSGSHRMGRRSTSIEADPATSGRLAALGDDPERALLRAERERLVREAIVRLPEPLRAAVLLYDYQDLSHQQVAELLGIDHAAARKRYSRALKALGKLLKGSLS
jgi:RNA polymerase sigma-70 factor, ECF subfamily